MGARARLTVVAVVCAGAIVALAGVMVDSGITHSDPASTSDAAGTSGLPAEVPAPATLSMDAAASPSTLADPFAQASASDAGSPGQSASSGDGAAADASAASSGTAAAGDTAAAAPAGIVAGSTATSTGLLAAPTPEPEPASSLTPEKPVVVAIGDSIMAGHGLDDPSGSWPELVAAQNDWQLTNFADDGTGFVQPGDAGDTFQSQADQAVLVNPSIVIVAASSNDLGVDGDDLAAQTESTMESIRAALPNAQIVALSAFWGDTEAPDELQQATDDLRRSATATGATFVDIGQPLADQPSLMQDDDVHPTAEGQQVLATAIGADVAAALSGG